VKAFGAQSFHSVRVSGGNGNDARDSVTIALTDRSVTMRSILTIGSETMDETRGKEPHVGVSSKIRPWCAVLFFAVLWFALLRQLSNEWSANEQYGYGWFVPFFAAVLFWLRWEDPPVPAPNNASHLRTIIPVAAVLGLLALLPLRVIEGANPDWRPLSWIHALLVVALTLGALGRAGGKPWLRHFAFPVAFILVAVPWIPPIEVPVVQGLMRFVAIIASETLNLCGIAAQLEGSTIRISSGVVGVNEACSGVRSLQTSLMIGLLFGELKRLTPRHRLLLIASALGIAFAANCLRAISLVWIAVEGGLEAVRRWHDPAGFAIVGAVFVGTLLVAAALARKERWGGSHSTGPAALSLPNGWRSLRPWPAPFLCLAWLLFVEGSVEGWYRVHEREFVGTRTWSVLWPEQKAGFRELPISEEARATLRFDRARQASWNADAQDIEERGILRETWLMFFFRWEPGTTSVLRARAHRPDICLPNTGWRLREDHGVREYPISAAGALPFRHFTFTRELANGGVVSAEAFFCQRDDRVPESRISDPGITSGASGNWAPSDRLRAARQGWRNQGQQVLELVLLGPGNDTPGAAQERFAQLLPQVVTLGPL
jgi:exosortase